MCALCLHRQSISLPAGVSASHCVAAVGLHLPCLLEALLAVLGGQPFVLHYVLKKGFKRGLDAAITIDRFASSPLAMLLLSDIMSLTLQLSCKCCLSSLACTGFLGGK